MMHILLQGMNCDTDILTCDTHHHYESIYTETTTFLKRYNLLNNHGTITQQTAACSRCSLCVCTFVMLYFCGQTSVTHVRLRMLVGHRSIHSSLKIVNNIILIIGTDQIKSCHLLVIRFRNPLVEMMTEDFCAEVCALIYSVSQTRSEGNNGDIVDITCSASW